MALSWSAQRRLIYGGGLLVLLVLGSTAVYFRSFYHAPTCSDRVQNGDETGVDCGGSCQLLCTSDALTPIVLWTKVFNISGDVYNATAYVENPNANSKNAKAEYEFRVYDDKNILIDARSGEISIPKNKKFAVFEPGFVFKNRKPKYADFRFTSFSPWIKDLSPDPQITTEHSTLLATSSVPRIEGTISNASLSSFSQVEMVAFVQDSKENVIATARTFIQDLAKRSSQDFVFTWPKPIQADSASSCGAPLDAVLLVERSGSIASSTLPQFSSAFESAGKSFSTALGDDDRLAIVSYASTTSDELALTASKSAMTSTFQSLAFTAVTSGSNMKDALDHAALDLKNARKEAKKVVILVARTIPTEPHSIVQADLPKISAVSAAASLTSSGITPFVIGLGADTNSGFLADVAGDDSRYISIPDISALSGALSRIKASLCDSKPNAIQILYRIVN
jgi:hypothetical protein